MERRINNLKPIYDKNSDVLILGTCPGGESLEKGFYYEASGNKFWKVISDITGYDKCITREEKTKMLLDNKIAIWDVLQSCDREGSSDVSIINEIPNDLSIVIENSNIKRIYANGNKAKKLYNKYQHANVGIDIKYLPSTSGTNTRYKNRLAEFWGEIKVLQSL